MPIEIACACGKRFRVADQFAGRSGKCPGCGAEFAVPVPKSMAAAEPVSVLELDEPDIAGADGGGLRSLDETEVQGKKPKGRTCNGCGAPIAERAIICTACGRSTLTGKMMDTETGAEGGKEKSTFFLFRPMVSVLGRDVSLASLLILLLVFGAPIVWYVTGPGKALKVYTATPVRVIPALATGATRDQFSILTGTGDLGLGVESFSQASDQGNDATDDENLHYSVGGKDQLLITRPAKDGDAILLDVGLRQGAVRAAGATSGYDSVIKASDFELIPRDGGAPIPATLLYSGFRNSEARLDLMTAKTSSVKAPLPPAEPTVWNRQVDGPSVSALAVFKGDTEGTVRLSATRSYDGMPGADGVFAYGELDTTHPDDANFNVQHRYEGGQLTVDWADGDSGRWAKGRFKKYSNLSPWYRYEFGLLFEPSSNTPVAGTYDLHYAGKKLSTVKIAEPQTPTTTVASGGGTGKPPKPPAVSPIKLQQGVPSHRKINPNNPLSYFDILIETKDRAEGIVSASNLRQIGLLLLTYTQDRAELPDSFEDLRDHSPGIDGLLANPRTGENPGFIYEKPPPGADPALTPVVWEAWQGKKDPNGAVLYADGSIR